MSNHTLNGRDFERMVRAGLRELKKHEKEINRLNVFPVADGDTGVNMRLTLENGIRRSEPAKDLGEYLNSLSDGMLLGARGNSGVILSQIFKGISVSLREDRLADTAALFEAFVQGYKTAYDAVIRPVEGTILTVAREGIEAVRPLVSEELQPEELLCQYLKEMKAVLLKTPELLPVLAESGVIDSGGQGFVCIVEGMYRSLAGEEDGGDPALVTEEMPGEVSEDPATDAASLDLSLFDEDSSLTDGYCLEFLLQRMKDNAYEQAFHAKEFAGRLEQLGESIVLVEDGLRVKVHIHTKKPAPILTEAQKYGEFLTFKLENMQIQHNEHTGQLRQEAEVQDTEMPRTAVLPEADRYLNAEKKVLSVIAVANGEGIRQIYLDLGCDIVLDGGATMNTSTEEFLQALGRVNADTTVILANDPNIIPAAEQAAKISGREGVTVLPARTQLEGYYALAMDVPDSGDTGWRLKQMRDGISSVDTLAVTAASRDYSIGGRSGQKGSIIGLTGDRILYGSDEVNDAVIGSIREHLKEQEREIALVFRGKNVPEETEEALREALAAAFPDLECEIVYGGQPIFHWLIGLS